MSRIWGRAAANSRSDDTGWNSRKATRLTSSEGQLYIAVGARILGVGL
jgi:hypothetical protein